MKTKIHQIVPLVALVIMLCLPMVTHGQSRTTTRTGTITRTKTFTRTGTRSKTFTRTSTKELSTRTRTGTRAKTFTATDKGEDTLSEKTIAAKKSQHVIAILASSPVKGISNAAKKAQQKTSKAKIMGEKDAIKKLSL